MLHPHPRILLGIVVLTAVSLIASGCLGVPGSDTPNYLNGVKGSGGIPAPTPSNSPFVPPFGPGGSGGGSAFQSFLSFDQQTGVISGYAYMSGSASAMTVAFYINGPVGTGTLIGSMLANQSPIGAPAGTGFTYTPSSAYIDSVPRKLYPYAIPSGSTTGMLIGGTSIDYFAGPDANGLNYFTNNLSSTLANNCAGCHGALWGNYYNSRAELGNPSPLSGGTATNNVLYMKASGMNHGGGNRCSGNNICQNIMTWFGMDFGK